MLIHHDWQQLMPTDRTETLIPPAGEAPQLPRPLQCYRLQPTPPSQSTQMPFYQWEGTWDAARRMARTSLYPQHLSGQKCLSGDQCRDGWALLRETRQMHGQTLSTSLRGNLSQTEGSRLPSQHRLTKGMQASHSLFCAHVSPTIMWFLSQRGK